ncbi:unnamed protein product [Mytilus coruscus]|uniref:Uncharacterized protein n=1 Tax=Mytilus coruscus TaxID=42192 RepID=A0A6J8BYV5_MYTCO|nr:unnamed protein product [Mytilus coruscus]
MWVNAGYIFGSVRCSLAKTIEKMTWKWAMNVYKTAKANFHGLTWNLLEEKLLKSPFESVNDITVSLQNEKQIHICDYLLQHINYNMRECNVPSMQLSSKIFDFKNVEHLNFHNNLLGIVLPDDINGEIFHNLESLIELILSKNRIPNLPENSLKSQRNLQKLDLSENIRTDITFRLSHVMHLKELDLSGN